jgi:hypothetical protein
MTRDIRTNICLVSRDNNLAFSQRKNSSPLSEKARLSGIFYIYKPTISFETASWLDRFEPNGWVAREQVLGVDAMEKVPREFLAQNRLYANPPTLLLAVERLLGDEE